MNENESHGGKPRLQVLATPTPGPSSSGGNNIFQIQCRCRRFSHPSLATPPGRRWPFPPPPLQNFALSPRLGTWAVRPLICVGGIWLTHLFQPHNARALEAFIPWPEGTVPSAWLAACSSPGSVTWDFSGGDTAHIPRNPHEVEDLSFLICHLCTMHELCQGYYKQDFNFSK